MRSRRGPHRYEDDLGRQKRVDRSALRVIARRVAANDATVVDQHDLYILDPKRSPERLGKRRK